MSLFMLNTFFSKGNIVESTSETGKTIVVEITMNLIILKAYLAQQTAIFFLSVSQYEIFI